MAWDYKREESNQGFTPIPEGKYRIRIKSVEKAQAKSSGNNMLVFQFDVSGKAGLLFYNLVFLKDRPEITNRNLTQFFDSFKDIPDGNFEIEKWVGKVGACQVKHEEYNGNTQAKIHYFIKASEQDNLPAWVEPERKSKDGASNDGFKPVDGNPNDLPFF